MKVTVMDVGPRQKTLEVTIDSDKVEGAYNKAFKKVLKKFTMPGFRKGKVPAKLAKKYITDEGLAGDVLEDLIPPAYQEALDQESLTPLSEPNWDVVKKDRGQEMVFKVTFEVKPTLDIKDYKGMEITQEREDITDTHVEEVIDNLRKGQSQLAPVEGRGLEIGDMAVVDYVSRKDGEEFDGGRAENYMMEVQREHFIPGFVDELLGLEAGQEKSFNITFPDDYDNQDLAGKEVTFDFKVNEIKERQLPEADDDFAKSVSDFDTMAEFREHVEKRLKENLEKRTREQISMQIYRKLLEQVSNDSVPQGLHGHRTNLEIRRQLQELSHHGTELEPWLQQRGISQEQWFQEVSAAGMFEARLELLIDGIAAQEKITVDEEEVTNVLEEEAKSRRIKAGKLRDQMRNDGRLSILKYTLLYNKVTDFVVEQADITYVAPGTEAEEKPKTKKKKSKKKDEPKEESKAEKSKKSSTKKTSKKDDDKKKAEASDEAPAKEKKKKKSTVKKKKDSSDKKEAAKSKTKAKAKAKTKAKSKAKKKTES